MNKRQKKKEYKKKYGYNPPKVEIKYHSKYCTKTMNEALDALAKATREVVLIIQESIANFSRFAKETIEYIETMSEEDFSKFMESNNIDANTKIIARRIRNRS